ncbi:unnamed protein product [Closterium sp. NIES-64]|nr:unnamed protein product [Closterium sp. NIES-64]
MCQPKFLPEPEAPTVGYGSRVRLPTGNRSRTISLQELMEHFHLPINEAACKWSLSPFNKYEGSTASAGDGRFVPNPFQYNARVASALVPCVLVLLGAGGPVVVGTLVAGLMLSYVLDALQLKTAAFVAIWTTFFSTAAAIAFSGVGFAPHVPVPLSLLVLLSSVNLVFLCGVWVSLQFRWLHLEHPFVVLTLERLLFACTPLTAVAIVTWGLVASVGIVYAPYYLVPVLFALFWLFSLPAPSSFRAAKHHPRLRAKESDDVFILGSLESAIHAAVLLFLPLSFHVAVHRNRWMESAGDICDDLLLFFLPVLFLLVASTRGALHWLVLDHSKLQHVRVVNGAFALAVVLVCGEVRVIFPSFAHYIHFPPPLNYILVTLALFGLAFGFAAHLLGLITGLVGTSVLMTVLLVSSLAASLVLGMPLTMLPAPAIAAVYLAHFHSSRSLTSYLIFAAAAAIAATWFVLDHFFFLALSVAGVPLRSICQGMLAALLLALLVPAATLLHRPQRVTGVLVVLQALLFAWSAELLHCLQRVAGWGAGGATGAADRMSLLYNGDGRAEEGVYPSFLVVTTTVAGLAAVQRLHAEHKIGAVAEWVGWCVYLAKLPMLAVSSPGATLSSLLLLLAITPPFFLYRYKAHARSRMRPGMAVVHAAAAVAAVVHARFMLFDIAVSLTGHRPSHALLIGALLLAAIAACLPILLLHFPHSMVSSERMSHASLRMVHTALCLFSIHLHTTLNRPHTSSFLPVPLHPLLDTTFSTQITCTVSHPSHPPPFPGFIHRLHSLPLTTPSFPFTPFPIPTPPSHLSPQFSQPARRAAALAAAGAALFMCVQPPLPPAWRTLRAAALAAAGAALFMCVQPPLPPAWRALWDSAHFPDEDDPDDSTIYALPTHGPLWPAWLLLSLILSGLAAFLRAIPIGEVEAVRVGYAVGMGVATGVYLQAEFFLFLPLLPRALLFLAAIAGALFLVLAHRPPSWIAPHSPLLPGLFAVQAALLPLTYLAVGRAALVEVQREGEAGQEYDLYDDTRRQVSFENSQKYDLYDDTRRQVSFENSQKYDLYDDTRRQVSFENSQKYDLYDDTRRQVSFENSQKYDLYDDTRRQVSFENSQKYDLYDDTRRQVSFENSQKYDLYDDTRRQVSFENSQKYDLYDDTRRQVSFENSQKYDLYDDTRRQVSFENSQKYDLYDDTRRQVSFENSQKYDLYDDTRRQVSFENSQKYDLYDDTRRQVSFENSQKYDLYDDTRRQVSFENSQKYDLYDDTQRQVRWAIWMAAHTALMGIYCVYFLLAALLINLNLSSPRPSSSASSLSSSSSDPTDLPSAANGASALPQTSPFAPKHRSFQRHMGLLATFTTRASWMPLLGNAATLASFLLALSLLTTLAQHDSDQRAIFLIAPILLLLNPHLSFPSAFSHRRRYFPLTLACSAYLVLSVLVTVTAEAATAVHYWGWSWVTLGYNVTQLAWTVGMVLLCVPMHVLFNLFMWDNVWRSEYLLLLLAPMCVPAVVLPGDTPVVRVVGVLGLIYAFLQLLISRHLRVAGLRLI